MDARRAGAALHDEGGRAWQAWNLSRERAREALERAREELRRYSVPLSPLEHEAGHEKVWRGRRL